MTQEELVRRAFEGQKAPYGWRYCFNEQCPLHADCATYLSSKYLREDEDAGSAVFPNAYRDGSCRHFKKARLIRTAWGFTHLFDNVRKKDVEMLKQEVIGIIGSKSYYYQYRRGEHGLTPEGQKQITKLFKRYGYDEVEFDQYKEEVGFYRQ